MSQEYFKLNGITVKQPDSVEMNIATTSTDDSGRNQYLEMTNIPIGSVQSYSVEWSWLTPTEMSQILKQVLNKPSFSAHYPDGYEGRWADAAFYATTFNAPSRTFEEGEEKWDKLSFSMIGISPI